METIKVIKSIVDKLPYSEKGQDFYRDQSLTGFGLKVQMLDASGNTSGTGGDG